MRYLILCGVCLALLTGCGTLPDPSQPEGQLVIQLERIPLYESAAAVPLTELEPYPPWISMEPDRASADTMRALLCDALLPDGTEVICYQDPGSMFVKYWAIRQAEPWLVFAADPNTTEDSSLPVEAVRGGWETLSPETEVLSGRLRFTAEAVYLEVDPEKAAG